MVYDVRGACDRFSVFTWGRKPLKRFASAAACRHPAEATGIYAGSLSPHEERVGRELERGDLNKTRLLSPALSSFLRQEERKKCSAIWHFSTCVDTNG